MACECISVTDRLFKDRGDPTRIDSAISLDGGWCRARVATCIPFYVEKKRGQKAISLIASFCPLCGTRYEDGPA